MQTRRKIFETNSSSSHSIVVVGDPEFVPVEVKGDKSEIYVSPGEGHMEEEGHDWEEIASLAYQCAMFEGKDEWVEMLKKVIEDYTKKPVEFNTECWCDDEEREENKCECLKNSDRDLGVFKTIFESEEKLKMALFRASKVFFIDTTSY